MTPAWVIACLVTAGGGVLLWAGLEKARNRRPLAATLTGLGVPPPLAGLASVAVPAAELGTVANVIAGGPRAVSGWLLIALGAGFAAAATLSRLTGRRVECACFGSTASELGWRQVAALPLWVLTGSAAMRLPTYSLQDRLAVFAGGTLAIMALRAIPVMRAGVEARADRRAAAGA
jgi:hypothetical protein